MFCIISKSKPEKRKLYSPNAQQYKTLYVLWTYFKLFTLKYLQRLGDLIYDSLYYVMHYFHAGNSSSMVQKYIIFDVLCP